MKLHLTKRWMLFLCLCMSLLLVAGCSKEKEPEEATKSGSQKVEIENEETEPTLKPEDVNKAPGGKTDKDKNKDTEKKPTPTVAPVEEDETGVYYAAEGEVLNTVMIYMLGTDLESGIGAASNDIVEMASASVDTRYHNVVVYAGGASKWHLDGLSAEYDSILYMDENGELDIYETVEPMDMCDPDTLAAFIEYAISNFPAEHYELILWNHGSGPVLGYGVNETYDDTILLPELRTALKNSLGKLGEHLEWIGFDACLMNTMEVADVVAPYADYMIASQETEPGFGWFYLFLSELESNKFLPGNLLAKEIIDSYMYYGEMVFEDDPSYYADMTLSCLDLSKYQAAEDALNKFFKNLTAKLDTEEYADIIVNRQKTREFAVYSSSDDYDMVDVVHMLKKFKGDSYAEEALLAVEDMIVYNATNMRNANGVCICYPYDADADYKEAYMIIRENIGFMEDYGTYLEKFSKLRSEKKRKDSWDFSKAATGVKQEESTETSNVVTSDISLQLTEEQVKNFAYAGYHILCNAKAAGFDYAMKDSRGDDIYFLIHQGADVTLDEDGKLHAYYGNQAMYVKNLTTGDYSGFPLILFEVERTEDEIRYTTGGVLHDMESDDISEWTVDAVDIQIVVNEEYPDGVIRYVIPSGSDREIECPNKQLYRLEDFSFLDIVSSARYVTRDENGQMLSYGDWESTGWMNGFDIVIADGYELEYRPLDNPEAYACIFYTVDLEGNRSYSELIPLG